jgi:hypothetical protein
MNVPYIAQLVDSLSKVSHHSRPAAIDYPPGLAIGFAVGLLIGVGGMLLLDRWLYLKYPPKV